MKPILSPKLRGISLAVLSLFLGACQPADAPKTSLSAAATISSQPNFLVILADDLGYTDLGYFGSEIKTPNIDSLANNGLVLTNYYSAPLCAPTRTEFLTGTDHHIGGQGLMDVNVEGYDGYEGRLNDKVLTLADRLKTGGYNTFMTGKWHLGKHQGQRPASRGFDESFIITPGGTMHFAEGVDGMARTGKIYFENDKVVDELPSNFYSTDAYTHKMIEYIDKHRHDGKPFFAYLAYTAPHWPLQAPANEIAAHQGKYQAGYGALREQRFQAWKDVGMGKANDELPDLPQQYTPWENLTSEEQAKSQRAMETYAAMVEHMDSSIGEMLEYLSASGQLDNTVVIFQSDNGAEANPGYYQLGAGADNSLENIGKPGSFVFLGPGWAEAGSAPFRQNKTYTTEGGIHVPAMIYGPKLGIKARRDDSLIMTYDLAPTLLDLAGIDFNTPSEGQYQSITGRSFADLINNVAFTNKRGPNDIVGREHAGHGAIRKGDWKLTWENDQTYFTGRQPAEGEPLANSGVAIDITRLNYGKPAGVPIGSGGPWKLFNLKNDPAEKYDLSQDYPDILADMLNEWQNYVNDNHVIVRSGNDT